MSHLKAVRGLLVPTYQPGNQVSESHGFEAHGGEWWNPGSDLGQWTSPSYPLPSPPSRLVCTRVIVLHRIEPEAPYM